MKLNQIFSILKKRKILHLHTVETAMGERQYLSDGYAIYILEGLPRMDASAVCRIFDISEKDRDKWLIKEIDGAPGSVNLQDTSHGEKLLDPANVKIYAGGYDLKPLRGETGILLIDTVYLSPLTDELATIEYYERVDTAGNSYVVAKQGMIFRAAIMPTTVPKLSEQLQDMAIGIYNQQTHEKYIKEIKKSVQKDKQSKAAEDTESGQQALREYALEKLENAQLDKAEEE